MFKRISIISIFLIIVYACSTDSSDDVSTPDTFDRGAMLTNIADNIIIPSFNDFNTKLSAMQTASVTFTTNPSIVTLNDFRTAWKTAYKSWQNVEMFDIGKAEELQYRFYMNIYPITVADIEGNISTGSYDLNSPNNHDAQGFPALDYLLYGVANTDADIVAKFTTDANATGYKTYVTDVVNQMTTLTTSVVNDWATYKTEFVNSTTNTATSSLNKLVNDYIFYYEKGLRANKIGIPAGVFSANPLPEKVEAYYNQEFSKELTIEALDAVINLFAGGNSSTSIGFEDYLISLDRQDLATSIKQQFNTAKTQINTLDNNFSQQVNLDNTLMTRSYDELQKAVVLLKVDMLQAFNVSVDYVDADGD